MKMGSPMAARYTRFSAIGAAILVFAVGGVLIVRKFGAPPCRAVPPPDAAPTAAPNAALNASASVALGVPPNRVAADPERATPVRRIAVHVDTGRVAPMPGTIVWFQGRPDVEAAPDPAGDLEIDVPDGATLLVGRLADGRWARTTVPSDVRRVELVFASASSLAGTVRAPDGSPRFGFRLRVNGIGSRDPTRRDPGLRDFDRRAEVIETTTDVAGAFEVRGLESRHVEVEGADAGVRLLSVDGVVSAEVPALGLALIADVVRMVEVRCVDSKTDFPVTCQTVAVTNWPTGYTVSLLPAFPPRQLQKFPWPAAATETDAPVIEFLASGYLPRTVLLDASVPVEDGVSTIRLDRDPAAPAIGSIRIVAPDGFALGWLNLIELIEPRAENHVFRTTPTTLRGQRYLAGVTVGEWKIRVLGRVLDSTIVVRAGETTDLTLTGPALPHVALVPRLGEHAIGGRVVCMLTPDASKRRADGSTKDTSVTQTFLDVGPGGTAALGVLAPGAYSVLLARDTDSGKATFTVPEAGASSEPIEPILVEVPMVARPTFGDWSK